MQPKVSCITDMTLVYNWFQRKLVMQSLVVNGKSEKLRLKEEKNNWKNKLGRRQSDDLLLDLLLTVVVL